MEQHKWTESGRELLRLVENEITQSGGRHNTIQQIEKQQVFKYSCDKPECYFCQKTKVNYRPVVKVLNFYMKERESVAKGKWHPSEFMILRENINLSLPKLRELLRFRTPSTVRHYRARTAKRMGLKYDWHKRLWT